MFYDACLVEDILFTFSLTTMLDDNDDEDVDHNTSRAYLYYAQGGNNR